jgi:chromosome segregation ATPase
MIFALGFLVAGLFALLFLPAVQRRAARLSARRLEMLLPLSMEEIVAERDQLRAEFAVERRRIEQKLEAAGEAAARHMGQIGRQSETIDDLAGRLADTREELRVLGEAKGVVHREVAEAEAALGAVKNALADESSAHGATRAALDRLQGDHAALEHVLNEQRASLAGLETRAAALDLRIVALTHQKQELEKNLQAKISEAEVLLVERDLARAERDGLETKRATLQRRLDEEALGAADLRDQIEALRRRVDEAERARVAGEQAREAAEQRHAAAASKLQQQESRMRSLQTTAAERHATQVAEIATLGGQLEVARREHASLQEERRLRESEAARKLEAETGKGRAAEAEWQARYEKQAAEIATLTTALERARQQHAGTQHELGAREREARREKNATASPVPAAAGATTMPDPSNSHREETALLRQAIADLGSEVVRITASLKASGTSEDGASMPPDMIEVRERRGRARAQP